MIDDKIGSLLFSLTELIVSKNWTYEVVFDNFKSRRQKNFLEILTESILFIERALRGNRPKNQFNDMRIKISSKPAYEYGLTINLSTNFPVDALTKITSDFVVSLPTNMLFQAFLPVRSKSDSTNFYIINTTNFRRFTTGRIPTYPYLSHNFDHLYSAYLHYLFCVVLDFFSAQVHSSEKYGPVEEQKIRFYDLINYLVRTIFDRGLSKISQNWRQSTWRTAIYNRSWLSENLGAPTWIPLDMGTFMADPFIFYFKEDAYCAVEVFVENAGKGHIEFYHLGDSIRSLDSNFELKSHLSFPFVFEYEHSLLMCPETSELNEIALYECVNFPGLWTKKAVLVSNQCAVDSLLFNSNGYWWIFTNPKSGSFDNFSTELRIYYSEKLIGGEWLEHSLNPIHLDSRKARNGGLLRDGKNIFRVGQKQGFNNYGESASIYQINTLSPTEYDESEISTKIFAESIEHIGSHHISSAGNFTAIDYNLKPSLYN